MLPLRRLDYEKTDEFMKENRLREITFLEGRRITRNKKGGLNIFGDDDSEGLDYKFYIDLLRNL